MKRALSFIPFISFLAVVIGLAGCEQELGNQAGPGFGQPPQVEVAVPIEKEVTEWDEFTGRLAAVEAVDIRARVSGYLESVHFKEGAMVQKGDLLYIIDPRPYEAALKSRKAELVQAQARLKQTTANLKRGKELVAKKAISQEVYDQRVEEYEQARAAVEAAQAAVQLAELDVEYTHVRAPITGRISRTLVTPGNLVSGGSSSSTLLTRMVSMDPIHFYFTGDERDRLRYLRLDLEGRRPNSARFANAVRLQLPDEEGYPHRGVMDFVDTRIDEETGTITGRAIFDNPDHLLVPGMFAKIKLKGEGPYQAFLIPDKAVITDQSQQYVFVLDENNTAQRRVVTAGIMAYGLRVIRDGLSADDRVIVNGLSRVRAGMTVQPVLVKLEPREEENSDFGSDPDLDSPDPKNSDPKKTSQENGTSAEGEGGA
ncbi:efflux RND transporter periplasmic adaptor subunit [Luteithermobacter gelatinilyticus]|uniref:efflux RND transporter periplasmic adaptor subunit n=1 Tax=Luteithermobacter gelatinilyticus TaxID=2582913 RepID=UPI00143CD598|nr:efflux RND transporter periplasmic adaptor subunit [Luteithermobacter gelatinilyticus]